MFKFEIYVDDRWSKELKLVLKMLDEIPDIEIKSIHVLSGNNKLIKALLSKSMFQNKKDLFKVLNFDDC